MHAASRRDVQRVLTPAWRAPVWGAILLAFLALSCAVPAGYGQAIPPDRALTVSPDTVRTAIAVRGGVSKGSYLAGLNYGLLYLMRKTHGDSFRDTTGLPVYELSATTGASAGSINALIGSIAWCSDNLQAQPPDSSLFWKIWTPVGFEQLFPKHPPDSSQQAEYIFTRAFFDEVLFDRMWETMEGTAVSADCQVPFGMTMTRADAASTVGLTDGLSAKTTRHVSLAVLEAQKDSTRQSAEGGSTNLRFRSLDPGGDATQFGALALPDLRYGYDLPTVMEVKTGNYHIITPRDADSLNARTIFDHAKASSAFPLAFAPMKLEFQSSPDQDSTTTGEFLDGGVFDNKPLDLAWRLSRYELRPRDAGEPQSGYGLSRPRGSYNQTETTSGSDVQPEETSGTAAMAVDAMVVYLGTKERAVEYTARIPEQELKRVLEKLEEVSDTSAGIEAFLRREENVEEIEGQTQRRSLEIYGSFLERALETARNYELEVLARDLPEREESQLDKTGRHLPIVGEALGSFGAFFGRAYREHDFYVGLYDATRYLAERAVARSDSISVSTSDPVFKEKLVSISKKRGSVPTAELEKALERAFAARAESMQRSKQRVLLDSLPMEENSRGDALVDTLAQLDSRYRWNEDGDYVNVGRGRGGPCEPPEDVRSDLVKVACAASDWERGGRTEGVEGLEAFSDSLHNNEKYWPADSLEQEADSCETKRDSEPPEERYKADCFVDPITLEMVEAPRQTLSRLAEAAIQDLRTNETLIDTAGSAGAWTERITEIAHLAERTAAMPGETGWFLWPHSSMPSRNLRGQPTESRISAAGLWRLLAPQELFFDGLPFFDGFPILDCFPFDGIGYSPRIRPPWPYSRAGVSAVLAGTYLNYAKADGRIVVGGGLELTPTQWCDGWLNLVLQNLQARVTAVPRTDWLKTGGGEVFGSVGLELSGHFLYGNLRVAFHQPTLFRGQPWGLLGNQSRPLDKWAITVGVSDLTGLGYWIRQLAR